MEKQNKQTTEDTTKLSTEEASKEYDKLTKEAEADTKAKKPGSQSNSSDQHNNGRGGGK